MQQGFILIQLLFVQESADGEFFNCMIDPQRKKTNKIYVDMKKVMDYEWLAHTILGPKMSSICHEHAGGTGMPEMLFRS